MSRRLTPARAKSGRVRNIKLAPGAKIRDLVVKLPVQGVVTGRVVDEDGEPLDWVIVQLERPEPADRSEAGPAGSFRGRRR